MRNLNLPFILTLTLPYILIIKSIDGESINGLEMNNNFFCQISMGVWNSS